MTAALHPDELVALRRAAAARARRAPTAAHHSSTFSGAFGDGAWNAEVPTPRLELVLETGGRWELDLDGRRVTRAAFLAGPHAGLVRTRSADQLRLVQLSLDPLAAPVLFGMPAGELSGEVAELDEVLGPAAGELLEIVDAAWHGPAGAADAAWAAEAWLARRLEAPPRGPGSRAASNEAPADVRLAAALFEVGDGRLAVADVAAVLGCSRRHLTRRFTEWMGMSPSEHRRLVRLDRAATALRERAAAAVALPQPAAAQSHPTLGEVAATAGYADHAHMVRDFQALVGMTPSAYAARRIALSRARMPARRGLA